MNRIIVTKDDIRVIPLSEEEIRQIKEENTLQEFEQSLQPSQEEIENAEFELKLIEKLFEWGII